MPVTETAPPVWVAEFISNSHPSIVNEEPLAPTPPPCRAELLWKRQLSICTELLVSDIPPPTPALLPFRTTKPETTVPAPQSCAVITGPLDAPSSVGRLAGSSAASVTPSTSTNVSGYVPGWTSTESPLTARASAPAIVPTESGTTIVAAGAGTAIDRARERRIPLRIRALGEERRCAYRDELSQFGRVMFKGARPDGGGGGIALV